MSTPTSIFTSEPMTDLGNAKRFVQRHGENIRYCSAWGKWLVWDGTRWHVDDTGEVDRLAKETVRDMYRQASVIQDSLERKEFVHHATTSEYANRIREMKALAQTEAGIPVRPDDLDRDAFLLNCQNGTLNLHTGVKREHRRADLITKLAPVACDPDATCLVFERFLSRITGNDAELANYLQRCIGYALTGDVTEKALFVLYGSGNNGKTTFLEAVRHVIGNYAGQLPIECLMMRRSDGVSNDIAQLKGLRFVTSSEAEQGKQLAEGKVKQITGMGTLQARFLYHEPFQFTPTHKIFMDSNHKPQVRGTDDAIWNRIKLIPFSVSIPDSEIDKKLLEKLKAEASGILTWAVRGCLEWQQRGLGEPCVVRDATGEYREEMDIFSDFVEEKCTLGAGNEETVEDLFKAYREWCASEKEDPGSKRAFGVRLKQLGGVEQSKLNGKRSWQGIELKFTPGELRS